MSLESEADAGPRGRLLDNPLAIRAVAHPLRLDVLAVLGRTGQATAAAVARELGISHGLATHHLRQLAKYGFIEQVAGKDNRERPWKPVAAGYHWPDVQTNPEAIAATDALEQVIAGRVLKGLVRWQQRRPNWPAQWLDGSGLSTITLDLTAADLARLTAEFEAMVGRYAASRPVSQVAVRPPGSVPVDIAYFAWPAASAPAEG